MSNNTNSSERTNNKSWLSIIADRTHLYVSYADANRRYVYVNAKFCNWFKLAPEQIIGKTLKEIAVNAESYAAVEPHESRAYRGESSRFEIKLPEPQAGVVSLVCDFIPHFDEATGQVAGVVNFAQDVTEQELSIAARESSETRFRALTNTIPQLMWAADAKGVLSFANDRCLTCAGVKTIEAYVQNWEMTFHPEDRAAVLDAWSASIKSGEPFKMEYRICSESGLYSWFLGHAVPIRNDEGKIQYWIGTATNIEDERRREDELKQAKIAAEDASLAKSNFLANVSHEIRTPLGAILGFSELLKAELPAEKKIRYAEIISRNGNLLTRIIDDLLDLARVEAGYFEIKLARFYIRNLIEEVLAHFKNKALEKNISLSVDYEAGVPEETISDAGRLRQILINLISNAMKYTEKGSVLLRVESKMQSNSQPILFFIVKDTGCGISEQLKANLFQPFSQGDSSSTRRYGGTGLGLAISMRLAEALGGRLELRDSEINKGSTFVASILTEALDFTGVKLDSELNVTATNDSQYLAGIKVLVVDDSPDNLELVKHMLAGRAAQVELSSSGAEATQLVMKNSYDVVILDIQMPDMDGYQTIQAFHNAGFHKPVIAFTAHAMQEERARTKAAKFAYHLTKPINLPELISVVSKLGRGQ